MPLLLRHGLSIPAFLAVSALGCGADDDDDATTMADTGSATDSESSAGPTTNPSTDPSSSSSDDTSAGETSDDGSTSVADTASDTIADTNSTGGIECIGNGDLRVCTIEDQTACEADYRCLWARPGYCHANCPAFGDANTCCEQQECRWMEESCDYNGI